MSSPVTPVPGSRGPSEPMSPAPAHPGDPTGFAVELEAVERALTVDARTASPPPGLLEQVAAAGAVHDRLAAEGVHVSFSAANVGRPGAVMLQAADGSARSISLSEAGDIAAGKPLG